MNNILIKKLEAATVKLSELDQHIELEEPLANLVKSWATDCEIKNISQEDYDYLVNLLVKAFGIIDTLETKLNNQEYAYISIKEGGRVVIKNDDEGIVIDIYAEGEEEPFDGFWYIPTDLQNLIPNT